MARNLQYYPVTRQDDQFFGKLKLKRLDEVLIIPVILSISFSDVRASFLSGVSSYDGKRSEP